MLSRIAAASGALAATSSRLAKREIIAEVLQETPAAEIEVVVSYLSGTLRQRRTGIGWRALQALPQPAGEPSLTVTEVDQVFAEAETLSGAGSAAVRATLVRELFVRATGPEQQLLRGLMAGELR